MGSACLEQRQQSLAESEPDTSVQGFPSNAQPFKVGLGGWWADSRASQLANKGCSYVGRRITQNPKIEVYQVPGFRFLN